MAESSASTTQKNTTEFDQTYFHQGYLQDPLQDFIDDVLQNQTLSPNYDTGKRFFLNRISWHFFFQEKFNFFLKNFW